MEAHSAATARHQRSQGSILLSVGPEGLRRMREEQSAKVRLPSASHEAILINTGGGLAGGDRFRFDIAAEAGARLTVTSQAAERVYRSLGPAAEIAVNLRAGAGASLAWLPQETILFDGAALSRRIEVELALGARLLAAESVILGRPAMGEQLRSVRLRDRWRIRQAGKLVFADELAFDGAPPMGAAALRGAGAFATLLLIAPEADALVEKLRAVIGGAGGASAWAGKLVARLAARDGFELRKSLVPALSLLAEDGVVPKLWSF